VWQGPTGNAFAYEPVRSGADGTFRFETPDTEKRPLQFVLSVESTGTQRNASARVVLEKGRNDSLGILLERFPMGDLIGTTVDPSDRPIAGVHVTALSSGNALETDSDGQGRFRFAGFKGAFEVAAKLEGHVVLVSARPKMIRSGGWEPCRIVLVPTARLRVRVLDSQHRGVSGVRIEPDVSMW
jgi:hypothetical protein